MKLIDEKLGGTTPLEVILKFQKKKKKKLKMIGVMMRIGVKKKKIMINIGLLKIK